MLHYFTFQLLAKCCWCLSASRDFRSVAAFTKLAGSHRMPKSQQIPCHKRQICSIYHCERRIHATLYRKCVSVTGLCTVFGGRSAGYGAVLAHINSNTICLNFTRRHNLTYIRICAHLCTSSSILELERVWMSRCDYRCTWDPFRCIRSILSDDITSTLSEGFLNDILLLY